MIGRASRLFIFILQNVLEEEEDEKIRKGEVKIEKTNNGYKNTFIKHTQVKNQWFVTLI